MKLNKTNREEIIRACIAATFKQAEADLQAARTTLADAIFENAFGADEKLARKLPKGWIQPTSRITITCEGFCWSGGTERAPESPNTTLPLSRPRLEPYNIDDGYKVTDEHPCYARAQAVVAMHAKLHEAKTLLRQKLVALVHSVPTTDKLREAWPEGAAFIPADEPKAAPLPVPASLTREVNAMMGLKAA